MCPGATLPAAAATKPSTPASPAILVELMARHCGRNGSRCRLPRGNRGPSPQAIESPRMTEVGQLLREWRERRRLTQLELALDAGISSRHLSFVETGRSKPGRELLLKILRRLDVPFREQNRVLLAAGHAPAFPERPLDAPELEPVRQAIDVILSRHDPYPGLAIDRHWNLVAANSTLTALTAGLEIDPGLLGPPANILRAGLHPRGLAPYLANPEDWLGHFRDRGGRPVPRHPRGLARALPRPGRAPGRGHRRRGAGGSSRGDLELPDPGAGPARG